MAGQQSSTASERCERTRSSPVSPSSRSWPHSLLARPAACSSCSPSDVERWLGVGPGGFGSLLAAIGVGAAAGPLLLRRFIEAGDKRWLFGPFVVRGGVDLTLASVANPIAAGGALVAYGMSTSTGMVAYQSTLQTYVPAETRGRAFAFYDVLWNAARLLSLAAGGALVDIIDVRIVYAISAALLLAAAGVGLTTKLERPDAVSR